MSKRPIKYIATPGMMITMRCKAPAIRSKLILNYKYVSRDDDDFTNMV